MCVCSPFQVKISTLTSMCDVTGNNFILHKALAVGLKWLNVYILVVVVRVFTWISGMAGVT